MDLYNLQSASIMKLLLYSVTSQPSRTFAGNSLDFEVNIETAHFNKARQKKGAKLN